MKITMLALFAALLLSGCGAAPVNESPPADPATQTASSPPEKTADQIALDKVSDSLSASFAPDSYKVTHRGNTVTAVATIPELGEKIAASLASKTLPDHWEDTILSMTTIAQTLTNAVKEAGFSDTTAVLYIKSDLSKGDIYLTFLNGNLTFTIFDEPSEAPNHSTISLAEFNQIKTGMTYDAVAKIVGGRGEILSEVDIGDPAYYTAVIMWEGEGSVGANANMTIQGGLVTAKAQFGLE